MPLRHGSVVSHRDRAPDDQVSFRMIEQRLSLGIHNCDKISLSIYVSAASVKPQWASILEP